MFIVFLPFSSGNKAKEITESKKQFFAIFRDLENMKITRQCIKGNTNACCSMSFFFFVSGPPYVFGDQLTDSAFCKTISLL